MLVIYALESHSPQPFLYERGIRSPPSKGITFTRWRVTEKGVREIGSNTEKYLAISQLQQKIGTIHLINPKWATGITR
jgi:hypothetical protein